jgi:hypothetical protein
MTPYTSNMARNWEIVRRVERGQAPKEVAAELRKAGIPVSIRNIYKIHSRYAPFFLNPKNRPGRHVKWKPFNISPPHAYQLSKPVQLNSLRVI